MKRTGNARMHQRRSNSANGRPRSQRLRSKEVPGPGVVAVPQAKSKGSLKNEVTKSSEAAPVFHRILVPIDFSTESTPALKSALRIADRGTARILLVHVVGPIYYLRDYGLGPVPQRRVDEELVRLTTQRLRALGRRHIPSGLKWRVVVRSGTAPTQILKVAEESDVDLIIMPTRGLSHAPPSEVGSTAERVVRHAQCPVLVLPSLLVTRMHKKRTWNPGAAQKP